MHYHLFLCLCKDRPNIVNNSDDRQLSKELVSSQPSFSRLGIQASLSALSLSKTFRVAAKAIDLVGNPVREVGNVAFVAADIEDVERYLTA